MKRLILSAAIVLFSVIAFAQTNKDGDKRRQPKERPAERLTKDKDSKDKAAGSRYDNNNDGVLSAEERDTYIADKLARKEARKADRSDDGLLNGSADKDNHGRAVSGTARGTHLEGREAGEAVREVARPNRSGDGRVRSAGRTNQAPKAERPAGSRKPVAVGRKM